MSTICSTGQQVQNTFISKNTTPWLVQTTFFPESTFWQLEKQIWNHSRKNKQGFQTTQEFRFHLCCKTPINYRVCSELLQPFTPTFVHKKWYKRLFLHHVGNLGALLPTPSAKHKYLLFLLFSCRKLSIRFHHILLKQLHQENDSTCGINYACTWPGTKGYEVGEGRII